MTNVPPARAGFGLGTPHCPDLWQLDLSQHQLPSYGDVCGRCLGWVFPWGQQKWLAVFRAGGCLGTELCSSIVLCPPPPSLSGRHSGLAWGRDGFSEPREAEPFPLALSLWQLWQLCGCHRDGLMTLKVISHWKPLEPLPLCHHHCEGPLGIPRDSDLVLLWGLWLSDPAALGCEVHPRGAACPSLGYPHAGASPQVPCLCHGGNLPVSEFWWQWRQRALCGSFPVALAGCLLLCAWLAPSRDRTCFLPTLCPVSPQSQLCMSPAWG